MRPKRAIRQGEKRLRSRPDTPITFVRSSNGRFRGRHVFYAWATRAYRINTALVMHAQLLYAGISVEMADQTYEYWHEIAVRGF